MKVKNLIKLLQEQDPEMEVVAPINWSENSYGDLITTMPGYYQRNVYGVRNFNPVFRGDGKKVNSFILTGRREKL